MKKLLKKAEVRDRTTWSFAHIDRLERDGRFPKRVKLGTGRVAWPEEEIDKYISDHISKRDS